MTSPKVILMQRPLLGLSLLLILPLTCAVPVMAQAAAPGCSEDPAFHSLDFWHGEWQVENAAGERIGTNRIEPVLGGCAIMEQWSSADGNRGTSLFYRLDGEWRQVWVTPFAQSPGGVKEKQEIAEFPGEGIRFQGEISLPDGTSYLDRTTLSILDMGRVRQLIEVSRDNGETWQRTFDAIYLPLEGGNSP